jgi:hypothetical protein
VSGGYDKFMVYNELGASPKIGRLKDDEFRVLVLGVWALASKSSERGSLIVAGEPATAEDVAHQAHKPVAVARRALKRFRDLGLIEMDEEAGCEVCHDWAVINPAPKVDRSNAERQARHRANRQTSNGSRNGKSNADSNGANNGAVTDDRNDVTAIPSRECADARSSAPASPRRGVEVEVEVEVTPPTPQRGERVGGRPVDSAAWGLTLLVLGEFNRQADKDLGATTGSGSMSESAKRIYGRVREFPDITLVEHADIIRRTLASEWWGDGAPSVGVVYGPKVFEDNITRTGGRKLAVVNPTGADMVAALNRGNAA